MDSTSTSPLVSVLIPSYNHSRYVQDCIRSVIAQDYPNLELIIVDDGSSDDSVARIEAMVPACSARFSRFEFRVRPNKGLAATVNEGLEWAAGKYFATIASDDILLPEKTSTLVREIELAPDVAGVFGGCDVIDEANNVLDRVRPDRTSYGFRDIMCGRPPLIAPSQLLRRDVLRELGGYPTDLYIEDWYMWLSITERGYRLAVIPDRLVLYRRHESNMSKNASKMYECRRQILERFSQHPEAAIARANSAMLAAIDFSTVSKRKSLEHLVEAVSFSPRVAMEPRFAAAIMRLCTPAVVLDRLRRGRDKLRTLRSAVSSTDPT